MSPQPASLSPDIVRLRNEGYEVEIRGPFLLISHVPYVAEDKTIQYGVLVSTLHFNGDRLGEPDTHVASFIGSNPCNKDGTIIAQIQHGTATTQLAPGLVVNFAFSNKPAAGYPDYYQKMTRYVEIISAPAKSIDPSVTAQTFGVVEAKADESVFNYHDTNSTRAEIAAISAKLKGQKIGIVGLGGTGSYILDLVAKTEVAEIHLFDGDRFAQHNAFRAPGAPTVEQLRSPPLKIEYFAEIYSAMRRGIHCHDVFMDATTVHKLQGLDFVFICVDKGPAKKVMVQFLNDNGMSFIDVGMGVHVGDNNLLGVLRVTTSIPAKRDHLSKLISFEDGTDDEYSTNIQIADLNMLNAALAVVKWKKIFGFYQDLEGEVNSTYSINVNQLL